MRAVQYNGLLSCLKTAKVKMIIFAEINTIISFYKLNTISKDVGSTERD
jgi:hypothetical protein